MSDPVLTTPSTPQALPMDDRVGRPGCPPAVAAILSGCGLDPVHLGDGWMDILILAGGMLCVKICEDFRSFPAVVGLTPSMLLGIFILKLRTTVGRKRNAQQERGGGRAMNSCYWIITMVAGEAEDEDGLVVLRAGDGDCVVEPAEGVEADGQDCVGR